LIVILLTFVIVTAVVAAAPSLLAQVLWAQAQAGARSQPFVLK
jgi:hypothetical protein